MNRTLKIAPFIIVAIMFCALLWSVDFITLQGEWTVYTVECKDGTWAGSQCTGKLAASDRYRFRALKNHGEVFFWTVGARGSSGRLMPCEIESRANWSCQANAESSKSITLVMAKGRPVLDPAANTRPAHAVSKIKWMLLKYLNGAN